MREIIIPELIAAFFLFFSLVQPFVKGFRNISGLVWLPLAALLIITGIFPAYGWRPECVPLLVFEFLFSLISIPSMARSLTSRDYREPGIFITIPCFILFAGTVFIALVFLPTADNRLTPDGIREFTLQNDGKEYFLRIYGKETSSRDSPNRPFLFLVPPEGGSVPAVDLVCTGLRDRGITVLSYSRKGFDSPAAAGGRTFSPSLFTIRRIWRSFRFGDSWEKDNILGRDLETGRREDLDFLLPRVMRDYLPPDCPIFLVGYGAGGGALVYLAGNAEFTAQYPAVRGIIAIESPLWSVFQAKEHTFREIPENSSWFTTIRIKAENWFTKKKQRTLSPGNLPEPAVPLVFLMSDRVLGQGPDKNRYAAVYSVLRNSRNPAALTAVEGAGPLDYSACPVTHPVYRVLFPSLGKSTLKGKVLVDDTVTIITNFAALMAGAGGETLDLRKLNANLHIESRSWTLPDLRYILNP
jgi:hypothetical protein